MSKYGLLIELFQALSNYFSPSRIQKAACLLREGHEDIFLKHNVKETQSCGLQSTFLISTFVYGGEKMGFNCKTRVPAVGSPLKKKPHNQYFGFRSESRATLRPGLFPVVLKYERGRQVK